MAANGYVAIAGSEREPIPGSTKLGPCDPSESVQVTVVLRPRPLGRNVKPLGELVASGERLTRTDYEARYGANPEDVRRVEAFAHGHSLAVSSVNLSARTLKLTGTASACSEAFQVDLAQYQSPQGAYRGRTGLVYIPESLQGVIVSVHGLDNRPQAQPRFRLAPKVQSTEASAEASTSVSYTPLQVEELYNFPAGVNGEGETIGIIELGGGYNQSDLESYFSALGISPAPSVTAVSVDGTQNQPTGDTSGPDAEVMLDIEVAGAVAPGAKIAVYFAPNTDAGFLDAINQAVGDKQNNPSVISISWGGAESTWTSQSLQSYNSALQAAAAVGISVCIAAGDDGSTDGVSDGLQHVDFPASSPYALACGGTHLIGSGSTITDEVVWNDLPDGGATGGGVSATFPLPSWQAGAHVPPSVNPGNFVGRGVPDVAGDADPETGYQIEVDGANIVVGGTSAVAPLWAGLIACFNSSLKTSVGYFNPTLYQQIAAMAGTFHDITSGNNGSYQAGPGWDACTGWGSPNGVGLINALAATSSPAPTVTLSASPTSLSVVQGDDGTSTITTVLSGGFDDAISLSATGQPSGVTVSFNPTSIAAPGSGSSTMTLAVASTTENGTYTITVTGTGGSTTETTTVTLQVTAPVTANFTPSASPSAITVARRSSGNCTITTAISGGFDDVIGLSATGQPLGVTVRFSPKSMAAPGSGTSTMEVTVSSRASTGTYSITITGTGGSTTQTTTVALTVSR
jgi:kumamolisin